VVDNDDFEKASMMERGEVNVFSEDCNRWWKVDDCRVGSLVGPAILDAEFI
jgi:hypothetical protein